MQSTTQTFMNEMDRAARATPRPAAPPVHEPAPQAALTGPIDNADAAESGDGEAPPEKTL